MSDSLVLRSRRVVLPGAVKPATVHVAAGVVARVGAWDDIPPGAPLVDVVDAGDDVIMPGIVDSTST